MYKIYPEHSEKQLITLLQQGDEGALTALYHTHVAKLKYYVQRTTKSPFLAEDIVHDTFVKIWENRSQINVNQPFAPYLFTIAKRHMLNLLKRAQHERDIIAEIRKYTEEQENTTQRQLDYNESNSLIMQAISNLSGQPKEVFLRCRIQGLTYKQAAEELGVTESTVNKHMNKALQLIRKYVAVNNMVLQLLLFLI